jgi:hypothetical protein
MAITVIRKNLYIAMKVTICTLKEIPIHEKTQPIKNEAGFQDSG